MVSIWVSCSLNTFEFSCFSHLTRVSSTLFLTEKSVLKQLEERNVDLFATSTESRGELERATLIKMKSVTNAAEDICISILESNGYNLKSSIETYLLSKWDWKNHVLAFNERHWHSLAHSVSVPSHVTWILFGRPVFWEAILSTFCNRGSRNGKPSQCYLCRTMRILYQYCGFGTPTQDPQVF